MKEVREVNEKFKIFGTKKFKSFAHKNIFLKKIDTKISRGKKIFCFGLSDKGEIIKPKTLNF